MAVWARAGEKILPVVQAVVGGKDNYDQEGMGCKVFNDCRDCKVIKDCRDCKACQDCKGGWIEPIAQIAPIVNGLTDFRADDLTIGRVGFCVWDRLNGRWRFFSASFIYP